jgi:hypothetical protein
MGRKFFGVSKPIIVPAGRWGNHRKFMQIQFPDHTGGGRASPGIILKRHLTGDWGEVDDHDRRENELSVVQGFRLPSAYTLSNGTKLWIITEADRSATALLLPSEY